MDTKGINITLLWDYTQIIALIEEYVKKFKFLDSLKTKLTNDINMIQGEEMRRLLEEQKELEKRYAELLQQADQLKGLAEKSKLNEVKKEISNLEKKIKENTKSMWKILKDNPDVNENRDKIDRNKKEIIGIFERVSNGLQNDNLDEYKKYIETEKTKMERLDKLKDEEKELIKTIKITTAEYNKQQAEFAAEEDRIKKEIKDLKQQLSQEQLKSKVEIGYATKEKDGELDCKKRILGYKESVIQKEIDDLKKQEENERTVNDRVLNFLKGRTTDYSRKGESWDQTNDQEQTRLDNEIRDISDERERIKDELERVQAKLKEEQEKERLRLEKEEKERQDKIDEEKRLVEMEAAIKWIQKKLVALHPFKPSKKKGKGMMGKMGKKK